MPLSRGLLITFDLKYSHVYVYKNPCNWTDLGVINQEAHPAPCTRKG